MKMLDSLKDILGKGKRSLAHRRLESRLSGIIQTATGHKRNHLEAGRNEYHVLYYEADDLIRAFCKDFLVEYETISAQIPAITELKALAFPPTPTQTAKTWAKGSLVAVLLGFVAILVAGFTSGLIQAIFNWGLNGAHQFLRFL
jgi:hypothetical protein